MPFPVTIEMAGFACAVTARERALTELLIQRYQGFLVDRAPTFTLRATVDPSAAQDNPLEISSGPIAIERHDHRFSFSGDHCTAEYDLTARTGAIVLPLNLTALDLLLKVVYAHYLLQQDAFFVHGCAVVRGREGHLFFGPSGSGKSTLADLATRAGGGVLADELVIVRREGEAFTVHGTPFWGGRNISADVRGVYALSAEHRSDAITAMTPTQALRRLLSCTGNFSHDSDCHRRLFTLAGSLVRSTSCWDLRFSTTTSMKGWVDAHLC